MGSHALPSLFFHEAAFRKSSEEEIRAAIAEENPLCINKHDDDDARWEERERNKDWEGISSAVNSCLSLLGDETVWRRGLGAFNSHERRRTMEIGA